MEIIAIERGVSINKPLAWSSSPAHHLLISQWCEQYGKKPNMPPYHYTDMLG
ncbi:MAG: hypothetical protein ACFB0C_18080 [Leptolyngbyaceae cyanobacterium]